MASTLFNECGSHVPQCGQEGYTSAATGSGILLATRRQFPNKNLLTLCMYCSLSKIRPWAINLVAESRPTLDSKVGPPKYMRKIK